MKMVVIPPVKLLERKNEFMLELKKVFFNATTEMLSFTEDFRQFSFREESLLSGWVSASKLSLKFWKPNPVVSEERVELTEAERKAIGASDFMVRIALTPEKDPTKVAINWIAIPVEESRFRKIADYKTAKTVRELIEG